MKRETPGFDSTRRNPVYWALFLVFLIVSTWAYSYLGAILILEKNTARSGQIQASFIDAVYQSASISGNRDETSTSISSAFTRAFPHYTDGVVDPLFPWLMMGFASQSPDELFESGKWLNFVLTGALLIVLGLAAARAFSFSGAAAIVLMGGFGVILERSAYFSPDALYYLLVVLTWLCALSLIRKNVLWLYGVFGILMGLSYLTKPLIWPIVAGFVIVSLVRSVWIVMRTRKSLGDDLIWSPSNQLVGFAMMISAFLLITGPRLSFAETQFGNPFHSYQNYFVWMDTPAEAARFQVEYPGKAELSLLAPNEKPGPLRFIQERGFKALAERSLDGALSQVRTSILGRTGWILIYGFFVFLVIAGIHWWAVIHQKNEVWRMQGASARWMLLFLGIVFLIKILYAGIGNPIIQNNAMTTSLFLPVLVTFIWISERYRRQLQRSRYATLVNRAYSLLMAVPIVWIAVRVINAIGTPQA